MRKQLSISTFGIFFCLVCVAGLATTEGQTYRRDYKIDAPIQYQAEDPWFRGFIYRNHINHAGRFYNCDGEECKRHSPYIYYTRANCDCHPSTMDVIRQQIKEVKWRIDAGACRETCGFPGCPCEPNVNLGCNVRPDSVNIDYSNLKARMAELQHVQPIQHAPSKAAPQEKNPGGETYETLKGSPLSSKSQLPKYKKY